jgi:hypothetical protein
LVETPPFVLYTFLLKKLERNLTHLLVSMSILLLVSINLRKSIV